MEDTNYSRRPLIVTTLFCTTAGCVLFENKQQTCTSEIKTDPDRMRSNTCDDRLKKTGQNASRKTSVGTTGQS